MAGWNYTVHTHKCDECGVIWEHDPLSIKGAEAQIQSHMCPECETLEFIIYDGDGDDKPKYKNWGENR